MAVLTGKRVDGKIVKRGTISNAEDVHLTPLQQKNALALLLSAALNAGVSDSSVFSVDSIILDADDSEVSGLTPIADIQVSALAVTQKGKGYADKINFTLSNVDFQGLSANLTSAINNAFRDMCSASDATNPITYVDWRITNVNIFIHL